MAEHWQKIFEKEEYHHDTTMDDRDYLYRLLHTIDWQSQLQAIRGLLHRNARASEAVHQEIRDSESEITAYGGPHHEHYIENHVYLLQQSIYSEAANSMAAIGMIAPMLESVFAEAFRELGAMYITKDLQPPEDKRWTRAGSNNERWNVQKYFDKDGVMRNDIISGIKQLSAASGVKPFLPPDVWKWIDAMLHYRNSMFHGGFEWAEQKRENFQKMIIKHGWQEYFDCAKSDHKPWVFYLTADTINNIPLIMNKILDGLAAFAKSLSFDLIAVD